MVMTESPIRRACNRCHDQKLSCKRSGDEPCERCIRLKAECKSSPSLRYRRNQHPTPNPDDIARPPKRKRTYEQPELAQAGLDANAGGSSGDMIQLAMNQVSAPGVAFPQSYPAIDLGNFGFDFGAAEIYNTTANNTDLAHSYLPRHGVEGIAALADSNDIVAPWPHQLPENSSPFSDTDLFSPVSAGRNRQRPGYRSQTNSLSLLSTPNHQEFPHPVITDQSSAAKGGRRIMLKSAPRHTTPEGTWLAEISEINSSLWDITASIPVLTGTIDDTDIYTYRPPERDDTASDSMFSLDAMFKVSRRFINALQEIIPSSHSSRSVEGSRKQAPEPIQLLDAGSSLLVLSTYVRLLELYQKAFRLVSLELSSTGGKEPLHLCRLPDISLGSFQVVSSQSMQVVLTIRLAENFLADLRSAIMTLNNASATATIDLNGEPSQLSVFSSVVAVSLNEVTAREKQIQHDLTTIREGLEAS